MLKKRRPLVEYRHRQGALEKLTFSQGYCLQFNFVRGGTEEVGQGQKVTNIQRPHGMHAALIMHSFYIT